MKTVVILRGLPGSGKSSVSRLFDHHKYVSMDEFWTKDGEPYKFDYARLAEAIQWTHDRFIAALAAPRDGLIVVDNVGYLKEHFKFFIEAAKARGAVVHIVHIERPLDELTSHHDVPSEKILEMAAKWEPIK